MNNDELKNTLYILIAIFLGIVIVRFIIWLLPIILIGICSYFVYKSIKKNRNTIKKQSTKKKNIKIIDMVEED